MSGLKSGPESLLLILVSDIHTETGLLSEMTKINEIKQDGEMTSIGTWEPPGQDWPKADISGSYPGRGSSIKERSDKTTLR